MVTLAEIAPELPRHEFIRRIWDSFSAEHKVKREISSAEYDMARKWAMCGCSLATVLQGIHETTGTVRRLEACERAVLQNIARRQKATA